MPGISEAAPVPRRILVSSTSQAWRAVAGAAASGHRVAVSGADLSGARRGGTLPPRVVDLSPMNAVYFDEEHSAFAVEAGARLSAVHHTLYERWGVNIPSLAGPDTCGPDCLTGRHRPSTARRLAAEYLYAIEVVLVDTYGRARSVVATREPGDRHRDLWLAHKAVGAEHFGLVTRYWFRSPGADGGDPAGLLPQAPASLLSSVVVVPNGKFEHAQQHALFNNYRRWHRMQRHTNAGSVYRSVFGGLTLPCRRRPAGVGAVLVQHVDSTQPDAERMLESDRATLTEGLTVKYEVCPPLLLPWLAQLHHVTLALADPGGVLPTSAGCVCGMCQSTARGLRDVQGAYGDSLIAFDVLHCRGRKLARASTRRAGPFWDTLGGARSPRCRSAVQTRAAMAAWDPRGVFH